MEPIFERGCDAQVAAAATQSPEEVGVLVRTSRQHVALDCNQVNRQQVIAGEAVLAHEEAMAAAERQAGDASRPGYPTGGCQTKGLRLMIEVPKWPHPRRGPSGVSHQPAHPSWATGLSSARRRKQKNQARRGPRSVRRLEAADRARTG